MAAGTWTIYDKAIPKMFAGTINIGTTALRCRIFKAQAAASVSNFALSTITQIGVTNRAAAMSDYTLSVAKFSVYAGSTTLKMEANNIVVTASGAGGATSLMYAVVYASGASANALHALMWCKLSTAAFPVTDTNTLTITAPTTGYFVVY